MKLKMAKMNSQEMQALEQKVGYLVCSFNHLGMHNGSRPVSTYNCSVDGGLARGGQPDSHGGIFSMDPCSLKYAENCPLFQQNRRPFYFEEGGAMSFSKEDD